MTRIIPQELWDEIINHLHDDKSSLGNCGLVCKLWLWPSRSHLFSTILLRTCDINTALAILSAPGSTIPPHVRALQIEGDMGRQWDPPWVNNVLAKLPHLSAVKKLSLAFINWDTLTPEAKEYLFTISRGLKSLTLDYMAFKTLGQALQSIASAPSLDFISLGIMNINVRSKDTPLTKSSAPPIRHIVFGECNHTSAVINWLCLSQPTPSVRKVTFDGVDSVQIRFVSAYIRQLGSHLEHLELAYSLVGHGGEPLADVDKEINFTQNTSLKTISIDNLTLYHDSHGSRTYDWIIDILSRITSRFMERVTMVISLNNLQELTSLNLPALAALFAQGNRTFAELSTRLQFGIYGAVNMSEARAAIAESLRELDSQGRLEFGGCRISPRIRY